MITTATDECEYCGRPADGERLIETKHNGLVCADCDEIKPWKY
jgi:ribosome-binding protein aMBF1 (putative translation factor)